MRIITEHGYIDGVAVMFEVTEAQLERIKFDRDYYMDKAFVEELKEAEGKHAHVLTLINTKESDWIYRKLKEIIREDYESVSWWDKESREFKITRR